MTVTLVFRKKNPAFFSIERVFSGIEDELHKKVLFRKVFVPQAGVSLWNIIASSPFFKKEKSDIYHITGDIHYTALGFPKHHTLLTIHDCVFLHQTKGLKRLVLKKLFLDWPVRRSALITTISESSKQDILKNTGCPPHKIMVIPNPVHALIQHQPKDFCSQRPVILFVGITPNKNLARVIQALQNIPCLLHIVGKVPDAEMQLLRQYNIEYKESLHLSDKEMAGSYANADLLLFPSTFEGFGLPIIEAQKTGRPVITSDIDPMKEVAGEAACLVDPFSVDSIRAGVLKVIGDEPCRSRLIASGFQNIRRFDGAVIAQQYLDCYQKLSMG